MTRYLHYHTVSISQNASIADNYRFSESLRDSEDSCKDVLFESYPCHGLIASPSNTTETLSESIDSVKRSKHTWRSICNSYIPAWWTMWFVCIPDLRKAAIDVYGQSVQVGNYMHRLSIAANRFSSIFLKRLKAHNVLSSKATLHHKGRVLRDYWKCSACIILMMEETVLIELSGVSQLYWKMLLTRTLGLCPQIRHDFQSSTSLLSRSSTAD